MDKTENILNFGVWKMENILNNGQRENGKYPQVSSTIHRKKRFTSFPSPAGMSLTKLPLGRNNSLMTSLFPPRESLVVTSWLRTGTSRIFFLLWLRGNGKYPQLQYVRRENVKISSTICFAKMEIYLTMGVSPAYGFIALALDKCSNDRGPGPRQHKGGSRVFYF